MKDTVQEALELLSGERTINIFCTGKYFSIDFNFKYKIDEKISAVAWDLSDDIQKHLADPENVNNGHKITFESPTLMGRSIDFVFYDQASGDYSRLKVDL